MIVLDTHIIVWDALNPEKLSEKAKETISRANEEDGIIFCDISLNLPAAINKDPADRIIAATSIINNAPLITADENLCIAAEITSIW